MPLSKLLIIRTLLLGILISQKQISFSQDSTNGTWNLQLRSDFGFIIAHRPQLENLQEGHVRGFEVSFARISDGEKDWQTIYNYPDHGLTFAYFNLATDKLGSGIAVYPFIDFPLNNSRLLHLRFGMGLGYIENIFDATENFKNSAIGTHFNGVIHIDIHLEKKLSPRLDLEFGTGITHFSNGSNGFPNLGLNIATVNLGLQHSFGKNLPVIQKESPGFIRDTAEIHVYAGGFYKKIYPPEGRRFFAATLSAIRIKQFSKKSFWGAGVDFFYDNSISYRIETRKGKKPDAFDNFRQGIYGAYQLGVGNMGVMLNMGYYLYNPWLEDGNFYHRICLRYYFTKTFICVNLKTHFARADYIELGYGLKIR